MLKLEKVIHNTVDVATLKIETNVAVLTEAFYRYGKNRFNGCHLIKWRIRRSTKVKCKIFHKYDIGCPHTYYSDKTITGGVGHEI